MDREIQQPRNNYIDYEQCSLSIWLIFDSYDCSSVSATVSNDVDKLFTYIINKLK